MRPLRIAFVTDEFVTERPDGGGLGHYLHRMTRTLHDLGHEVEVITRTSGAPSALDFHGVRVESTPPAPNWIPKGTGRLAKLNLGFLLPQTRTRLRTAKSLARVFARRDAERRFDVVQSTNCSLAGIRLARRPGLRHLIRLSSARDLWEPLDRTIRPTQRPDFALLYRLERLAIRRADAAYAPSHFLAEHWRRVHGLDVEVLRPPVWIETKPAAAPPPGLPARFLLHFGTLTRRKGSEWLARALPLAWEQEPGLTMVWAGREHPPGAMDAWRALWGSRAGQVRQAGALEKPALYAALERATATVLPSLVDNLPNTAIESLLFGVPVIATHGASLDELVVDGESGELIPADDAAALAAALVRCWRGEGRFAARPVPRPPLFEQMLPEVAAEGFLRLAGAEDPA